MKFRSIIPFLIAATVYAAPGDKLLLIAQDDNGLSSEQRDLEALRDWINTKRQVTVKERGGNLSISGEVRAELQSTGEKKKLTTVLADGSETAAMVKQRGDNGATSRPTRAYDVEVNLMLDYRTDNTWASIKLEFDNDAGSQTGTSNRITLERAYLGGRVMDKDTYTFVIEIGRRSLITIFDSKIQFGATFDGILFRYDAAVEDFADLYIHAGPFLVNELQNQYAYVAELGMLNIANTGLYIKYSLIDWDTKQLNPNEQPTTAKRHEIQIRNREFDFFNNQVILGYKFIPKWTGKVTTFYAAALLNTAARRLPNVTRGKKANFAGYIGMSMGELRKKFDWSFDINYQWVEAQAVPGFDSIGIERGNAKRVGMYGFDVNGTEVKTTYKDAVGPGNYKGIAIEFLYLFSNNMTLFQSWQQSVTLNQSIGPSMQYKQYEIELIYAF